MMVNLARLGGDPAQLSRTLFHEMLHSDPRFSHNACEYCRRHYPSCLGRQETKPDGGTGNVSQGVGAWCDRLLMFCDTAAECDSACSAIGSRCERTKSVCDRNCN